MNEDDGFIVFKEKGLPKLITLIAFFYDLEKAMRDSFSKRNAVMFAELVSSDAVMILRYQIIL